MGSKPSDFHFLDQPYRPSPYEYDSTGMPGIRVMVLGHSEVVSGSHLARGFVHLVQSPLAPWCSDSPPEHPPDAGSLGTADSHSNQRR